MNKHFSFKQFTIHAEQCGMPVSTDGVILGAWAFTYTPQRILDIGCGTGLLSLMCAQRFVASQIMAIDIDHHAYECTLANAHRSPWKKRVQVIHGDIADLALTQLVDGIICNPPYFNQGQTAQQTQRAIARHTKALSHQKLLNDFAKHLTIEGCASVILPYEEGEAFIDYALQQGWSLTRLCRVKTTSRKPPQRILFEISRQAQPYQESELIIQHNNAYSEAFISLTRDFYLKMM